MTQSPDNKHIRNESVYPCDIDGTLVVHMSEPDLRAYENSGGDVLAIKETTLGTLVYVAVNNPMIRILKEESKRGSFVIAWSRGGHEWANDVINALELRDYVDLIISKPKSYGDDKNVETWLTDRVFVPHTESYKLEIK